MRFYRVKVLRTLPHPGQGFTQGLIAEAETVWESGGQYGMSVLRRYALGAAEVTAEAALPRNCSLRESAGWAAALSS